MAEAELEKRSLLQLFFVTGSASHTKKTVRVDPSQRLSEVMVVECPKQGFSATTPVFNVCGSVQPSCVVSALPSRVIIFLAEDFQPPRPPSPSGELTKTKSHSLSKLRKKSKREREKPKRTLHNSGPTISSQDFSSLTSSDSPIPLQAGRKITIDLSNSSGRRTVDSTSNNTEDTTAFPLLFSASRKTAGDAVFMLPDLVGVEATKFNAFMTLIEEGNATLVSSTLSEGHEEYLRHFNKDGVTALQLAVASGEWDVLNILLSDPNICLDALGKKSGRTALHIATQLGNAELVAVLLAAGANIHVRNSNGDLASTLAKGPTTKVWNSWLANPAHVSLRYFCGIYSEVAALCKRDTDLFYLVRRLNHLLSQNLHSGSSPPLELVAKIDRLMMRMYRALVFEPRGMNEIGVNAQVVKPSCVYLFNQLSLFLDEKLSFSDLANHVSWFLLKEAYLSGDKHHVSLQATSEIALQNIYLPWGKKTNIKKFQKRDGFWKRMIDPRSIGFPLMLHFLQTYLMLGPLVVTSMEEIYHKQFVKDFTSFHQKLRKRHAENPALFSSQAWRFSTPEVEQMHQRVSDAYQDYAKQFFWNSSSAPKNNFYCKPDEHLTVVPVLHGTDLSVARKICRTGFSTVAAVDDGYFGQGMYFSSNALYTLPYIVNKDNPCLILCYVIPGNVYPVIESLNDPNTLLGKPVMKGYQSHFVLTNVKGDVYRDSTGGATYTEFVMFQESQIVPACILTIDKTNFPLLMQTFNRVVAEPKKTDLEPHELDGTNLPSNRSNNTTGSLSIESSQSPDTSEVQSTLQNNNSDDNMDSAEKIEEKEEKDDRNEKEEEREEAPNPARNDWVKEIKDANDASRKHKQHIGLRRHANTTANIQYDPTPYMQLLQPLQPETSPFLQPLQPQTTFLQSEQSPFFQPLQTPYLPQQSPYIPLQSPYIPQQSPYIPQQSPYIPTQSPYMPVNTANQPLPGLTQSPQQQSTTPSDTFQPSPTHHRQAETTDQESLEQFFDQKKLAFIVPSLLENGFKTKEDLLELQQEDLTELCELLELNFLDRTKLKNLILQLKQQQLT